MHGMSILEGGQVRALRRNTKRSPLSLYLPKSSRTWRERERIICVEALGVPPRWRTPARMTGTYEQDLTLLASSQSQRGAA